MINKGILTKLRNIFLEEAKYTHSKDKRIALYKKLHDLSSKKNIKTWIHFTSAGLAYMKSSFSIALSEYNKTIALDPIFSLPWNGKGNVLYALKKYDEALIAYDKAIALDSTFSFPWNGKGNALLELKKYDEALTAYDKAIALDSTYPYPWNNRGNVLLELKKYDEALTAYDKAIALDPTFSYPWNNRGYVLAELKKYDEALTAYDKAIALDPTLSFFWTGKGNVLFELKKYDEALTAYDKAIALDPTSEKAIALDPTSYNPWEGKGITLYNLEKYKEALAAYEKAIALDQKSASPWIGKGNTLSSLKKYKEALAAYEKAIELDSKSSITFYDKGLLLWKMERYNEAHAAFRKSLEFNPPDEELNNLVKLWLKRTSSSLKKVNKEKGKKKTIKKDEEASLAETSAIDLGVDIYQTLKDLRLLEEVENSRKEMKDALTKALNAPRRIDGISEEGTLFILRDWNSFTPILPAVFRPESAAGPSMRMGGGYFLNWRGHGIAIDPGIDFVSQLYKKGLSIADVDSVIVTHCHLDHTRDVESLVDLNYRFNINMGNKIKLPNFRQLKFFLSPAAYTKYAEYLKDTNCCLEPELMYGDKYEKKVSNYIEVRPIKVFHKDICSADEAIGLIFILKRDRDRSLLVGLTSDSKPDLSLAKKFKDCNILLAHLGTIETVDEFDGDGLKNHFGLKGCHYLGQNVQPSIFIIGEFGEELLDARLQIIQVMSKHKPQKTVCVLGADSNLAIGLGKKLSVLCCHPSCKKSPTKIPIEDINPLIGDDGLFRYYCSKHATLSR